MKMKKSSIWETLKSLLSYKQIFSKQSFALGFRMIPVFIVPVILGMFVATFFSRNAFYAGVINQLILFSFFPVYGYWIKKRIAKARGVQIRNNAMVVGLKFYLLMIPPLLSLISAIFVLAFLDAFLVGMFKNFSFNYHLAILGWLAILIHIAYRVFLFAWIIAFMVNMPGASLSYMFDQESL